MPLETADRRPANTTTPTTTKVHHHMGAPPPADQDPLPCPRCESTNTKFCYYNNYNFSQPRHFCKSCRRYWTHGGTLRDIPIGGGCRKNTKRCRTIAPTFSSASSPCTFSPFSSSATSAVAVSSALETIPSTPLFVSLSGAAGPYVGDLPLKPTGGRLPAGNFTSLLSATGPDGFLALGGFGLGLGASTGLEDVGFGLGRGVWSFPEVGYLSLGGGCLGGAAHAAVPGGGGGCDGQNGSGTTWSVECGGGESGLVGSGGECLSSPAWPGLAISTPGMG